MQFEALQVFCDIARCRSFSQAAAMNDLSQSAASQIVLHLEKRLGVQLVDRSTRPLHLTSLGKTYYEGCKDLIERYQELEAGIVQAQARLTSTVQVAAIYSVGLGDMNQFVERFMAEQPKAEVHIDYLHPDRVYERVIDGTVDFGLVSFPRKIRELTTLPWREELMVLACAPTHFLAKRASVSPANLAGLKYIGFEKGLVIRRKVDRFLKDIEAPVHVVLEFDNIENIKKAVEIDAGVALLPEPTLRREVEAGTLVALPLTGRQLVRPLGIIKHRQHKWGVAAGRFAALLREAETGQPAGNGAPENVGSVSVNPTRSNGTGSGRQNAAAVANTKA
ncbi:MAG: LysR family transcriptional regulator [Gemmataceae bacterium]